MNRKVFPVCLIILFSLLVLPVVQGAGYSLAPVLGLNYTVPSGFDPAKYGNWSNTKNKEGSCSNTTCWGTGFEDVLSLTGNEFFQEYHFNMSNSGISISDILSLDFCFSACWSGGVKGCGHGDEPEFDINNGTAQVQIYNVSGAVWEDVGTGINLGGYYSSSAMNLADYCKTKGSNFNDYLQNDIFKLRINVSGNYIGFMSECLMFTDYTNLEINLKLKPPRGGGGGSACSPLWECTDWGGCDLAGYKHRSCYDLNNCNVVDGMPDLTRKCSPAELCDNGLQDPGETGVDCGGACEPCPPKPTTTTTLPEEEAPIIEVPLPVYVCQPFEWPFWILYIFVLLVSYFTIYRFNKIKLKLKRENLLKILIVANVLLFILVLLDTVCSFRWYMLILLLVIFLTIVYLEKVLTIHKEKKKRK